MLVVINNNAVQFSWEVLSNGPEGRLDPHFLSRKILRNVEERMANDEFKIKTISFDGDGRRCVID